MWTYTLKFGKYTFYRFGEIICYDSNPERAQKIIEQCNARRISNG